MVDKSKARALDALLVAKARTGDRQAFTVLAERWTPRMVGHAYRLLGNREEAQDSAQDAWVEIVKGLKGLKHDDAFAVWALRIVSRRCARTIGKNQTDRTLKTELGHEALSTAQSTQPGFADAKAVRRAINALPSGQRAAIGLFYLEDFSVAEIAAALNVPTGTVKTRLMHARKSLRDLLEGGGNEPS